MNSQLQQKVKKYIDYSGDVTPNQWAELVEELVSEIYSVESCLESLEKELDAIENE